SPPCGRAILFAFLHLFAKAANRPLRPSPRSALSLLSCRARPNPQGRDSAERDPCIFSSLGAVRHSAAREYLSRQKMTPCRIPFPCTSKDLKWEAYQRRRRDGMAPLFHALQPPNLRG